MTGPDEDFVITVSDCRQAGHCARGIRRWFEDHGLDFRDFCRNGISAQVMWDTGDGQGRNVVSHVLNKRKG